MSQLVNKLDVWQFTCIITMTVIRYQFHHTKVKVLHCFCCYYYYLYSYTKHTQRTDNTKNTKIQKIDYYNYIKPSFRENTRLPPINKALLSVSIFTFFQSRIALSCACFNLFFRRTSIGLSDTTPWLQTHLLPLVCAYY